MTEMEANSIAEVIRGAALKAVHVEAVEQDPKTSKFQVKCRYHGPTFKQPLSRPNIQTQRTAYPQRDASLDQKTL